MKKYISLFFLIALITTSAQNLDSLYNEFLRAKGEINYEKPHVAGVNDQPIKCGFGIVNEVKRNFNNFSPKQRNILAAFLQRPTMDTSFVTPSGKFRIHFNKSGSDAPLYDLKEFAKAADSSYNFEIKVLGYPPPPKDNGAGGDDLYDIYIQNLSRDYGYTETDEALSDNTFTSFTVIDHEFGTGFYTHGINAARVTIAHEFHHAIQMGNYIYRQSDRFYHEITSTAMEEFVFDSVNDYYNYINTYFTNLEKSFGNTTSDGGYSRAIWNIFLKDRFGFPILKRVWEIMKQKRALEAIGDAIQENNSSFKVELSRFGQWCYFTGLRALPGKYFKEAANYPLIKPMMVTRFTKPNSVLNVTSEAASNNFLVFSDNSLGTLDTLVSLVSNCDIAGGISLPVSTLPFTYTLSSQENSGFRNIVNGFFSKLDSGNKFLLSESNIWNNVLVDSGQIATEEIDYAYPQPFRYSANANIFFPSAKSSDGIAELNIYSIDMNLVYSAQKRIVATDKIVVSWNGFDSNGKKLATGVYLYVTMAGDNIKKGKFVVYND